MGLGIGHYIPLVAYLGFWVMCVVSLTGRPLLGLYYLIPFLPYRTMRDHFLLYPMGSNLLTLLIVAVILGALFKGKSLPKSPIYTTWLVFGIYLYFSMWVGTALGNAPPPIWISDVNFMTWKDYMLIPLVLVAAGMVVEDRKAVRTVILIVAVTLLVIDRSCLMESLSRSWTTFDENKRDAGPLAYGSNQTAAFLAQFAMFFWGFAQFVKRKKLRLMFYGLVAVTIFADLYTFSRGSYVALILSVIVLGFLKDRKLIVIAAVFLFTWQAIVPTAVRERVNMTKSSNGKLEDSAQERVKLLEAAETSFLSSPVLGIGYASYQLSAHFAGLRDTHNWFVKVIVETGLVGMLFVLVMLQQVLVLGYRLFRRAEDPLYRGLGLGLFLAMCSCIVGNCFGDRWTYLEIMGMLWVLVAIASRALQLVETEPATEAAIPEVTAATNPFLAYR